MKRGRQVVEVKGLIPAPRLCHLDATRKTGIELMRSKLMSAFVAASLVAAPTVAAAQSAAPLAPASENVEGSEMRGGVGQVLPVFVIIAIVLLIREIIKDRDIGRDNPKSP